MQLMQLMQRRIALFAAAVLMISFVSAVPAYAQTFPCPYVWKQNLKIGSTGADVLQLQKFLNADPDTTIALLGLGAPGNETGRYGRLTVSAVSKFQEKYGKEILIPAGLKAGTGIVASQTRAKLNQLCAAASVSGAPASMVAAVAASVTQDTLTVINTSQPAQTLALAGAGGVPFTTITLQAGSNDVIVHSITASRVGPGVDNAFDSVSLNDENSEIGDDQHFDSNHSVVFREPFTIPAHALKTVTIMGNMAGNLTDYAGEMPTIEVDKIDASSNVVGQLPIKGTAQTINNTLMIGGGTASLSPFDPETSTNRYINDKGIRFSGIRITAKIQEDLTLSSIRWTQHGTAGNDDLTNVVTVINGTSYPTEADNREFTSTFSPGIVIPKGQTIDIYIQGDLMVSGVNRTVEFDIQGSDDVSLTGNTFGYTVGLSVDSDTAQSGNSVFITSDGTPGGVEGTPFFAGSVATINGATVTSIQNAN